MFKLMDKKIITILRIIFLLNWPYVIRFIYVLCNIIHICWLFLLLFVLVLGEGDILKICPGKSGRH